jgi:crotonobetainyl-CoA:carnitine CoA-transferase CaiB-like acyl-CoA transferase
VQALAGAEGLGGIEPLSGADLERVLSKRLAQAPLATWLERLPRAGVGAHPCSLPEEAMQDAWAHGHGVVREVDFPGAGAGLVVGPASRLASTPMRPGYPPPPIGWDGEAIVGEVGLGDRLADLVQSGALVLPRSEQVLV